MVIAVEPLTDELYVELLPLAQKCWDESTRLKADTCAFYGEREFAIEPDREKYAELQTIGALVIVTLRADGKLVGYVAGFTYRALHHRPVLGAIGDTTYLEPSFRAYIAPVVHRFLAELTARRAAIIGWPTTPDGPLHKVLLAEGFVGDDVVMEKRLCVSR